MYSTDIPGIDTLSFQNILVMKYNQDKAMHYASCTRICYGIIVWPHSLEKIRRENIICMTLCMDYRVN
jgi:hypothetical protein